MNTVLPLEEYTKNGVFKLLLIFMKRNNNIHSGLNVKSEYGFQRIFNFLDIFIVLNSSVIKLIICFCIS